MSCFLALECSTAEGSVALLESSKKNLKCLAFKKWIHQGSFLKNSHSDKLPMEIDRSLKTVGKSLSDLQFLAVGTGPGRWTGVRTGVNVIRALSFCLKIPIYSVNSLRICAEAILSHSAPAFVALNGFKNQVYFAKFHSPKDIEGQLSLFTFPEWCKQMESQAQQVKKNNLTCISDLEDFYLLPQNLTKQFSFKKLCPNALQLAQIVFNQKEQRVHQNWFQLKACYLRSPLE